MTQYEAICAFHPDLGEEGVAGLLERLGKRIEDAGGKVANINKWGFKDLLNPFQRFKKVKKAYYVLITFEGESSTPRELRDFIRVTEGVIRHLITRVN